MVYDLKGVLIGNDETALGAAVGYTAACAEVDIVAKHNGSRRALSVERNGFEIAYRAAFGIHRRAAQIAALGGEINLAAVNGDAAARIAAACKLNRGNGLNFLVFRIGLFEHEQRACATGSVFAVVGGYDHIASDLGCACPVEAALNGVAPQELSGCGIDADEVCILCLAVPEAGVRLTVGAENGRKRLTGQLVAYAPLALKRFCVEGLERAFAERRDYLVAVNNGRSIAVARGGAHLSTCDDLAVFKAELIYGRSDHDDNAVVGNSRNAGSVHPVRAKLICPLEHGVRRICRCLCGHGVGKRCSAGHNKAQHH